MTTGYLFDLDETLVTYEPEVPGIFRNTCGKAGVEPTEAATEAIGHGYVETFVEFEESPYVGAARAARETGLDVDPESFADTYVETELEATHVPDGIPELLSSLDGAVAVGHDADPLQRREQFRDAIRDVGGLQFRLDVGVGEPFGVDVETRLPGGPRRAHVGALLELDKRLDVALADGLGGGLGGVDAGLLAGVPEDAWHLRLVGHERLVEVEEVPGFHGRTLVECGINPSVGHWAVLS